MTRTKGKPVAGPFSAPFARTVSIDSGLARLGYSTWSTRSAKTASQAPALYTHSQTWPTGPMFHDLHNVGTLYEPEDIVGLSDAKRRQKVVARFLEEIGVRSALSRPGANVLLETSGDKPTYEGRNAHGRRELDSMVGALSFALLKMNPSLNLVEIPADMWQGGRRAEQIRIETNLLIGRRANLETGARNPKALSQDAADAVAMFVWWTGNELLRAAAEARGSA